MNTTKIKLISALLLAICLFLPLSKCQMNMPVDDASGELTTKQTVTYLYPYEALDYTDLESLLVVPVFIWPILFLAINKKSFRHRTRIILEVFQVLFCAASAYLVSISALTGKPLIGAYLAWFALLIYLASSLANLFLLIKQGSKSNHPLKRDEETEGVSE